MAILTAENGAQTILQNYEEKDAVLIFSAAQSYTDQVESIHNRVNNIYKMKELAEEQLSQDK